MQKSPVRGHCDHLPTEADAPVVLGNIGRLHQHRGRCVPLLNVVPKGNLELCYDPYDRVVLIF